MWYERVSWAQFVVTTQLKLLLPREICGHMQEMDKGELAEPKTEGAKLGGQSVEDIYSKILYATGYCMACTVKRK